MSKIIVSRKIQLDILALLSIAFLVCLIFRLVVCNGWTFIGDSDRLNAFLNIRLFEFDSIATWGRIPGWCDSIFGGVSMAGLHFMLPAADIFAYFDWLFPRSDLYRIMSFSSIGLVVLAGWAAYAYIKDCCQQPLPALTGAVLYCLSAYSINRIAQLDASFTIQIYMPLAMILIRRTTPTNSTSAFILLCILNTALIMMTFLQEVAYVIILVGLYACFRSWRLRTMAPVVVLGLSMIIAMVISFPRLYTVMEDFREVDRTKVFPGLSWIEVLRFFNESIFGRTQGEGRQFGNGTNLHEGLQLLGSSMAAFLVLIGALIRRRWSERIPALLLIVVLSIGIGPFLTNLYSLQLPGFEAVSIEARIALYNFFIITPLLLGIWLLWGYGEHHCQIIELGYFPSRNSRIEHDSSGSDIEFHLMMLAVVIAAVVIYELRYLLYALFFKVDFTHSRLSIAGLLPFSTLVALFLSELSPSVPINRKLIALMIGSLVFSAGFTIILYGTLSENLFTEIGTARAIAVVQKFAPIVVVARTIVAASFLVLLLIISSFPLQREIRYVLSCTISFLIIFEVVAFAGFKLMGPLTNNHDVPFQDNNYMNVARGILRPPSTEISTEFGKRVETDKFRSVTVADPTEFPALVSSHLAAFWNLRLIDGYSAGVPWRMATLPWPVGVRTLRSLQFTSVRHLPWQLLALLNVKYAIVVNNDLYFNTSAYTKMRRSEADPNSIKVVENPFPVTPRLFFAKTVTPGMIPFTASDSSIPAVPYFRPTAMSDGSILLSWPSLWAWHSNGEHDPLKVGGDRNVYIQQLIDTNQEVHRYFFAIDAKSWAGEEVPIAASGRYVRIQVPSTTQDLNKIGIVIKGKESLVSATAVNTGVYEKDDVWQWKEIDMGHSQYIESIKIFNLENNKQNDNTSIIISDERFPDGYPLQKFKDVAVVGANAQTYKISGITNGVESMFRMKSCEGAICSEYSKIQAIRSATAEIPTPGGLSTSLEDGRVVVRWKPIRKTATYRIERKTGACGTFSEVASVTSENTYSLLSQALSDPHESIRIRACEGNLCSAHTVAIDLKVDGHVVAEDYELCTDERPIDVQTIDLAKHSYAEKIGAEMEFNTDGHVDALYFGDRIDVHINQSKVDRFLVINELYHPRWRAYANNMELTIYPTDNIMRGIVIPAGVTDVLLIYQPFLYTMKARLIVIFGVILVFFGSRIRL